jgi:hypothetical protein
VCMTPDPQLSRLNPDDLVDPATRDRLASDPSIDEGELFTRFKQAHEDLAAAPNR